MAKLGGTTLNCSSYVCKDSRAGEYLAEFLSKHVTEKNYEGIIDTWIEKNEAFRKKLMELRPTLKENHLRLLAEKTHCDDMLYPLVKQIVAPDASDLEATIIVSAVSAHCPEAKNCFHIRSVSPEPTQTLNHLKNYKYELRDNQVVDQYLRKPKLYRIADTIITKERELKEQGYFTFVHGQRSANLLPELWFTWLWGVKNPGKLPGDFMFAHVKPFVQDQYSQKNEVELRHKLLADGRDAWFDRGYLLFLNAPYFGNLSNPGSCTAEYIVDNKNINELHKNCKLKNCFKFNGYSDVYEKFRDSLVRLEREFYWLSNDAHYGNVLLVAIPKSDVDNYVFIAKVGGAKAKVVLKNGENLSALKDIMPLYETPELMVDSDRNEFCLIMTHDAGMNPQSGIKVFPIIGIDPEKWAAFDAKQKALFQEIKQYIESQSPGHV